MEWNDPHFFPGSRSVACHLKHHECHNRMSESVSNTLAKATMVKQRVKQDEVSHGDAEKN